MKKNIMIYMDIETISRAKERNINISKVCNEYLKNYLELEDFPFSTETQYIDIQNEIEKVEKIVDDKKMDLETSKVKLQELKSILKEKEDYSKKHRVYDP